VNTPDCAVPRTRRTATGRPRSYQLRGGFCYGRHACPIRPINASSCWPKRPCWATGHPLTCGPSGRAWREPRWSPSAMAIQPRTPLPLVNGQGLTTGLFARVVRWCPTTYPLSDAVRQASVTQTPRGPLSGVPRRQACREARPGPPRLAAPAAQLSGTSKPASSWQRPDMW
jgi:hypothetical protein